MGTMWVLLSAFGFSTLGIFGKWAFEAGLTRNEMLFWRFWVSLPVFLVVLYFVKAWPKSRLFFAKAMLVGAVGIGLEASLFFMTLKEVGAAMTGVLLYLYPPFIALIQYWVFKKKLQFQEWLAVGLALFGCALTVMPTETGAVGANAPVQVSAYGLLLGVLTALWYAVYLIVGEKLVSKHEHEKPIVSSFGIAVGASFSFTILLCLNLLEAGTFNLHVHLIDKNLAIFSVLGLALVSTALPFATLYIGMAKIGATKASIVSTTEMVFTLILAALCLGEKLTWIQGVGAFLIMLSVLLIEAFKRK